MTNNYIPALIQSVAETTPIQSTQESPSAQERLCQLEMKSMTTTDWTEKDRRELLRLRELFYESTEPTKEELDALGRQCNAGIGNNPPLSEKERELIRLANSKYKSTSS